MRLFTFLPLEEIAQYEGLQGAEINRAKEVLAFEATAITHGVEEARKAQDTARARFGGSGIDQGPSVTVMAPTNVLDLAVQAGLARSRNAAKQYVRDGALRLDGIKVDADRTVARNELPALLSVGNRKVRLVEAEADAQ
jgi:tyrosyl-tRNA synthetase